MTRGALLFCCRRTTMGGRQFVSRCTYRHSRRANDYHRLVGATALNRACMWGQKKAATGSRRKIVGRRNGWYSNHQQKETGHWPNRLGRCLERTMVADGPGHWFSSYLPNCCASGWIDHTMKWRSPSLEFWRITNRFNPFLRKIGPGPSPGCSHCGPAGSYSRGHDDALLYTIVRCMTFDRERDVLVRQTGRIRVWWLSRPHVGGSDYMGRGCTFRSVGLGCRWTRNANTCSGNSVAQTR